MMSTDFRTIRIYQVRENNVMGKIDKNIRLDVE